MTTRYRFNTLEDFLISHQLSVDNELDDGWGAKFPVKGIELEAAILFADISRFSARTQDLTPTETLIFVNTFFSWITAEAIKDKPCIVDKYIGDEVMLLFAKEFGSEDPFIDALQAARWMAEKDALAYCPHIGISYGLVTAGYVGTPVKYNASLFGFPVTLASRCAAVKPEGKYRSCIVFPADLWGDRDFDTVFPPEIRDGPNGKPVEIEHSWILQQPRIVEMENIGEFEVREITNKSIWSPMLSAEDRAREYAKLLRKSGTYRPYEQKT